MHSLRSLLRIFRVVSVGHARRHWPTLVIGIVGIAAGIATIVSIHLTGESAGDSFAAGIEALSGRSTLSVSAAGGDLDEQVYETLKPLLSLAWMHPVLETGAMLVRPGHSSTSGEAITLVGVDLLAASPARRLRPEAADRHRPVLDTLLDLFEPDALVLAPAIMRRWGLATGDTVDLVVDDRRRSMHVRAVIPEGRQAGALSDSFGFQDLGTFQADWNRAGVLDRIDLEPRAGVTPEALERAAAALLPSGLVLEPPEQRMGRLSEILRAYRLNLDALAFVALLVGGFFIHNTVAVAVARRRTEVALMRALGATRNQIAWIFLSEAVLMGLIAWPLGCGLGLVLAHGTVGSVARTVNSLYLPTHVMLDAFTPALALGTGLLAMGVTLIAAWLPAREAALADPALALHTGAAQRVSHAHSGPLACLGSGMLATAALLALLPPIFGLPLFGLASAAFIIGGAALLLPLLFRLLGRGVRQVARLGGSALSLPLAILSAHPGRAAVAAASLMAAVALVGSLDIMVVSFRRTVQSWLDQTLSGDLFLRPVGRSKQSWQGRLDPLLVKRLASVAGVAEINTIQTRDLEVEDNGGRVRARLLAQDMDVLTRRGHLWMMGGDDSQATTRRVARQEGVLVSEPLARRTGLWTGSVIRMTARTGPIELPILGVFYDYNSDQGLVRIDTTLCTRLFGAVPISGVTIYRHPGVTLERLTRTIRDALAGHAITVTSAAALRREAMRIFDETFAVTRALQTIATLVALLGILGTLLLFARGEATTFATVRILGATRSQAIQLLMGMGLILGVVGALTGLAVAGVLGALLIRVVNLQSFHWTIRFDPAPGDLLMLMVVVPLAALVAGAFPGRSLANAQPAVAIRSE